MASPRVRHDWVTKTFTSFPPYTEHPFTLTTGRKPGPTAERHVLPGPWPHPHHALDLTTSACINRCTSSGSDTLPCLCRFLRLQVPCASSNPGSEVQVWAPIWWLEPYILQATQEGIRAYLPAGWLSRLHPSWKSVSKFPPLVKMLQRSFLAWPITRCKLVSEC